MAGPKADFRNPWMGMDGKICTNPKYWCRMHSIWLSEEDVAKKKCFARPTFDMISVRKCNCIEIKELNPFIYVKEKTNEN